MQLLSFEILDWVDPEEINLDIYGGGGPIGCFLEVVLDYPKKLNFNLIFIKATEELLSGCR